MANHKSAKKRLRQSIKKRASNRSAKSEIKTAIKKVREGVAAGKTEDAQTLARTAESLIASAAKKGILHKGNAKRNISKIARLASKTK